jgi:hypothetical protein
MTTSVAIILSVAACYLGTIVVGLCLVKSGGKWRDPLLGHTLLVNLVNGESHRGKLQSSDELGICLVEAMAIREGAQPVPIPGALTVPRSQILSIQQLPVAA